MYCDEEINIRRLIKIVGGSQSNHCLLYYNVLIIIFYL